MLGQRSIPWNRSSARIVLLLSFNKSKWPVIICPKSTDFASEMIYALKSWLRIQIYKYIHEFGRKHQI